MTNTPPRRGCDALLDVLKAARVPRIFTLSGNHIMPVFDAAFDSGIALVHTRHEAAAVHMADAHARITGEVGIALVTGGPGHANAVSALYTASMAEAPLVLLSGHAPHAQIGRGAFQEMRQAAMAEPVCKAAWTCAGADAVAGDMARAIRIACSGRPGPVHLSLPTDVLESLVDGPPIAASAFDPVALPLPADSAHALLRALGQARRPLVLAGPSCLTRAGRARLAELQRAIGVPVLGMDSPRGINDPRLGCFAQLLAQADCVLLLGKRLDFTLKFGQAPAIAADATLHQIDPDPVEIERTRQALGTRLSIAAQADVASALDGLTQAGSTDASHADAGWLAEVEAGVAWRPAAWDRATAGQPGRLHPVQMLKPLQPLLDSHPDAVLICDGGEIGQWASACLDAPHRDDQRRGRRDRRGACRMRLRRAAQWHGAPVVAVMGDGTVGFHISRVRHRRCATASTFVAVIGNDARWNAEYQIQLRDYGADRLIGCELRPDALRCGRGRRSARHGEQVVDAATLEAAIGRVQASGLTACLNAMIEAACRRRCSGTDDARLQATPGRSAAATGIQGVADMADDRLARVHAARGGADRDCWAISSTA